MLTTLAIAAFLAAPPAPWADPFAPAGPLCMADFVDPPQPKAKPAPYLATAEGLEWWALDQDFAETVTKTAPLVELMSSRQQQRIVYSALQCHAVQLLLAEGQTTEAARRRLVRVGTMAATRLERARITPLPCDSWPVERLAACLGLLPPAECTTDPDLALQVQAAERIAP